MEWWSFNHLEFVGFRVSIASQSAQFILKQLQAKFQKLDHKKKLSSATV